MTDLSNYLAKWKHNIGGPYPECVAIADQILLDCVNNLSRNQHLTSATLFQTGFGSWRASVALSLAGAGSQVPSSLRHALECAIYAYLCAKDERFEETWWKREVDEIAKKSMRGRVGPLARAKEILAFENIVLRDSVNSLLNKLIDFGAHPNVMLIAENTKIEENEENETHTTMLLGSNEARDGSHLMTSLVAIELLKIYREIWPWRFHMQKEQKFDELVGQSKLFMNFHHSNNYEDEP